MRVVKEHIKPCCVENTHSLHSRCHLTPSNGLKAVRCFTIIIQCIPPYSTALARSPKPLLLLEPLPSSVSAGSPGQNRRPSHSALTAAQHKDCCIGNNTGHAFEPAVGCTDLPGTHRLSTMPGGPRTSEGGSEPVYFLLFIHQQGLQK